MNKIIQNVTFKASVHDVFESLMDSKKHSMFTGDKAVISRKVGGKFTTFGGYSYGKNISIVKDKKIVQTWRASDWPTGIISTITFEFTKSGNNTKLKFTQENIPSQQYSDIKHGWIEFYWEPMKKYFEKII